MSPKCKRIAGIGFILCVALGFVVTVRAAEAQRTPEWHRALADLWPNVQMIETVRARWPEAFEQIKNYPILDGDGFAYDAYVDNGNLTNLMIALPERPRDVYCVVVRQNMAERLVFVNYYTDNLWHSGWVVLDGGVLPVDSHVQERLNVLGCRLTLQGQK